MSARSLCSTRDGLNALLHEAAEQNTTDLIITHLYRLGREVSTSNRVQIAIKDAGSTLHAISEEAIMANPCAATTRRIVCWLTPNRRPTTINVSPLS